jgi:transcriptional regulator with PAS, ATPase and Fis domain
MVEKNTLGPNVWEKVLSSPILAQTFLLLKQIFKRSFGFSDFGGMEISREEFRRIRSSLAIPFASICPFDFCDIINASPIGNERCNQHGAKAFQLVSTTGQVSIHPCHAGLMELYVPIMINGDYYGVQTIKGGLLFNQPNEEEWMKIAERVKDTGVDLTKLKQAYFKITPISQELLEIMLKLLNVIIEEIAKTVLDVAADKKRIIELENALSEKYRFEKIIGKSPAIQDVFKLLAKVIETDSTILIEGETGTGKELIANTIHYNSPRKNYTFTPVNCGSLAEPLLESELFGHIKGSFTGAIRDKKGLFEVTDKGTIFLDEIAEMSPALQVKLLRVLQEGTFIPVGGTELRKVDVRIISATNKNLKDLVLQGKFREDIYYRLNVVRLLLPPLRERREDIPLLIEHFIRKSETASKKKITGIKPDALKVLLNYHWHGNIRELRNVLERAISLTGSKYITLADMPDDIIKRNRQITLSSEAIESYQDAQKSFQKEYLSHILTVTKGKVIEAAQIAGMNRSAFQKLLKRHSIKSSDFKIK